MRYFGTENHNKQSDLNVVTGVTAERAKERPQRAPPWEENKDNSGKSKNISELACVRIVRQHPYFGNKNIVYLTA